MSASLIREHLPSPALREFVQAFWTGSFNTLAANNFAQAVVPNGHVGVIIHLTDHHCFLFKNNSWTHSPEYTIFGIYTRPYTVTFNHNVRVFGIRLRPEAFNIVFGTRASEFQGVFEDMKSVAGRRFADYCDRLRACASDTDRIALTEQFLLKNISRSFQTRDYVREAAVIIRNNRPAKIADLYEMIAISPRQLQREFRARIGVSPKAYLRLARMNAIQQYLAGRERIDLTALAYDHGFSDQSHFIKEFRAFTGTRPGSFLKERGRFLVNPTPGAELVKGVAEVTRSFRCNSNP